MSYKEDLKNMVPNFITYSFIFLLLFLFPSGLFYFLLAIIIPFILKDLFFAKKFLAIFTKKYFFSIIKTLIISSLLYYSIRWLGNYGWLGLIIIVLGVSGYKLWSGRSYFINKIREIEIMIWGKTNDRPKNR